MNYCSTLTDAQVRGVLEKEAAGGRQGEGLYREAREELLRRGIEPPAEEPYAEEPYAEDARPDYALAREELAAMVERLGLAFGPVEYVPAREETPREKRERDARRARGEHAGLEMACDPAAGRVRFTLRHKAGEYMGTYSAGSGVVLRWAKAALGGSAARDLDFPKSVDGHAALCRAARAWRPELVDVLGSMLSDVSGWEGAGPTFREWLEEGFCGGVNAADALETFEAIGREYRFLSRVFGPELGAAVEIAGRL